jgi:hypothetical protein
MKVRELLEQLERVDPDGDIVIGTEKNLSEGVGVLGVEVHGIGSNSFVHLVPQWALRSITERGWPGVPVPPNPRRPLGK